jgi:hypothetical protein
MSVHNAAEASQSTTCQRFSCAFPPVTEAVKVTTVPAGTEAPEANEADPFAMERLVDVDAAAA